MTDGIDGDRADDGESPPLRDLPEVLDAMRHLAARCAEEGDDALPAIMDDALRLLLEVRVPRMPDTDEELARMIEDGRKGPYFTTEEIKASLAEHGRRFSVFLAAYRAHAAACRWEDAARALMPATRGEGVVWEGGPYALTVSDAAGTATIVDRGADRDVVGAGADGPRAIVAAVMAAHVAWRDVWWR